MLFRSNIKGLINMPDKKFQNLKSHDCHVIMTQLLPVALRGLLPENVRLAIVKLCALSEGDRSRNHTKAKE